MDPDTVQDWIMAGNSAAMDWFALTHDKALPSQSLAERLFGADLGPLSPGFGVTPRGGVSGTQILVVGGLLLGLYLLFRK
jgi:hypothetical protein